jgi:hypothetical protein
VYTEILLPKNAPVNFKDRATLWNSVETVEGNSNAQLAREIEFSLPVELNIEQNITLVHEYVKTYFINKGMVADVSIHDRGDGNPHAHVMLTLRPIGQDGTWGAKSRKEYILDHNGKRIKLPNGEWKSRKINTVDWNDKTKADEWRKGWADTVNAVFTKYGIPNHIDHRSYERQGNGLTPTIHLGVPAHQMEQKGIRTEKGDYNRRVESMNKEIKQTKARIRKVKDWLYAQPLHNPPSLVEVMGKVAEGKNLKTNWQRIKNLQTTAKVLNFLTGHNINSVDDFADMVINKNERLKSVTNDIKKAEHKLKNTRHSFCSQRQHQQTPSHRPKVQEDET